MKIKDLNPKFPVTAQAIYKNKTLTEDLHNIPAMRRFIEKHEAQGAHWVVFTWEDHAETEDPWVIALEKRLSIGFTHNMQRDDLAEKEVRRG
jgi:hypothetical protein